ncbi:MAG: NAD-dependent epimerase/dehydratase family protein [Thermoleophilaceae bacterium]|jgi:nucleoside-diphosphate-sugar epimerase|nr:NAD-dependent epimerase/dehydratase family protein [Thermoleophilaceae bacterium]MBA3839610.1 NAD-dependent epimerase/dehydratase family protein [Thermoleophilaceae bacterium]
MRVVVTGATGNVGSSVVRALSDDPAVDVIIGLARRRPALEVPKVEWAVADVSRSDLRPLFRGADAVVHLAWLIQPSRDEDTTYATNVDGSERVFRAAGEEGVPSLVYASSVGAYSPGPKDPRVAESWPTDGIATSFYSRHKAEVERRLDAFEAESPSVRVVRLRPGLIFAREAASGIRRLFAGPFLPGFLVRPGLIPVVPDLENLRFQAVHSHDIAEAYRLAVTGGARGAFNVAAEPVLDPPELGRLLGARTVPVPASVLRGAASLTWRARLQPTEPGWLDMALGMPLMDTTRAREELGWQPRRTSGEALLELMAGMRDGAGLDTPPLAPGSGGPLRVDELRTGVGKRSF